MKKLMWHHFIPLVLFGACVKSNNDPTTTPPPVVSKTLPVMEWQKSLGGTQEDIANAIQPTKDGGYIIAGSSTSNDGDVSGNHGREDFWVVKLNSSGSIEWQHSYGGSRSDVANAVQQTADGGYIVAGKADSNDGDVTDNVPAQGGSSAAWVIRLSSSGTLLWQKCLALNTIGGEALDIQPTIDGGYVVAGNGYALMPTLSYGDVVVMKLNDAGAIQWSKVLGGGYHDNARSVQQTADGGYIIAGATASTDGVFSANHTTGAATYDYYIVKLNHTGDIEWQKIYGGKDNDEAYSVLQTTDGGYMVAGYSESADGNVVGHHGLATYADYWILKLNDIGSIQWQKSLGCTGNDQAYAIRSTADKGFVLAGYTKGATDGDVSVNHNTGTTDCWITKIDETGTLKWEKSYGGGSFDEAHAIAPTKDGGYIVAGDAFSNDGDVSGNHGTYDYWIFKLK